VHDYLEQGDIALLRVEYAAETAHPLTFLRGIRKAYVLLADGSRPQIDGTQSVAGTDLGSRVSARGRAEGEKAKFYPERAPPRFERWHAAGKTIAIFSSGSVQAQRRSLRETQTGRPTSLRSPSRLFSTRRPDQSVKRSANRKIATALGRSPR